MTLDARAHGVAVEAVFHSALTLFARAARAIGSLEIRFERVFFPKLALELRPRLSAR